MSIYSQLEQALKKENPIVEAFLTVGLTSEDLHLHLCSNVEASPLILSKFPPNYKVPETLPMFCFPWGMKLIKGPQETLSESFNFILYEETGTSLYCAAMIIYEAAGSSKSQASIFRTETRDIIDVNLTKNSQEDYSLLDNKKEFLTNKRSRSSNKKDRSRKTRDTEVKMDFQYFSTGQVMVPKCLVLVSKYPFFETLKKILMGIYKLTRTRLDIPIECYICHLFLRVPLPPKGIVEVVYQILSSIILIKIPPTNQLPLFDSNLTILFQSLPIGTILTIFQNILFEENVIFLSTSNDKLCSVSYSFLSLLYPFKWPFIYVPILPCQAIDQIYSPIKYVFGINSAFKEEVIMRSLYSVCIVDLDEGVIEDHNEMVNIKHKKIAAEPVTLPDHYSKKLAKQLVDVTEGLREGNLKRLNSYQTDAIRDYFFQFFVNLFIDYKDFLHYSKGDNNDHTSFFDSSSFINKQKTDKDFFRRFCKTQIFGNFCERNIKTSNIDQYTENLLFNEHIISKKNRCSFSVNKKPTLFIADTSNKIREKFKVSLPENCFSKKSYFFYYTFPELNYDVLEDFGLPKCLPYRNSDFSFPKNEQDGFYSTLSEFNTKAENLFDVWITLWTGCLWAQEEIERNERGEEIENVLEKMRNSYEEPNFFHYAKIIEGSYEVDPSIALSIFAYMNSKKVLFTSQFSLLLNKILHKFFTRIKSVVVQAEDNIEEPSGHFNQQFRSRTFARKGRKNSQNINMSVAQTCHTCLKTLQIKDELLKNFCCKALMTNTLHIIMNPSGDQETVKLCSVPELLDAFNAFVQEKNNEKLFCLETLRRKNELFWNLIWHFYKNGLGYKFFVPYERSEEIEGFCVLVKNEDGKICGETKFKVRDNYAQTDGIQALLCLE